jgi:hypothetical protein
MGSDPERPVTVAYIGGCMRSGSTLLDRVLSRVPGFVSVGEIVHLWERGVLRNELCGCGVPFLDCPFWTQVGNLAFGGWESLDVQEVIELQRSVDRTRNIPMMLAARDRGRYGRRLRRYADLLARLYRGIDAVSGGCVIVDSSKRASTAFVLRSVAGVRLRVIHLVRDSHGVAFSLMKRVERPEVTSTVAYMPKATPVRSALEWLAVNGLFHALRSFGTPMTLVRYESLVTAGRNHIQQIVNALGKTFEPDQLDFINQGVVELALDHTVSGNPMRFAVGDVDLRLDDAWLQNMPRADRVLTTVLTWPLLVKYGYVARNRR